MKNLNDNETLTIVIVLYKEPFELIYKTIDQIKEFKIIIIDNDNNVISKKNCYVKPDTFDVPYESTLIHGLDIDYLNKNGVSIHEIFLDLKKIFMDSLNPITKIISHNIDFDINILKSELYRYEYIEFLRFIQDI